MNTLKKAWYTMLVMIVAGIAFVSCNKSMDEPISSTLDYTKEKSQPVLLADSITAKEILLGENVKSSLRSLTRSSDLPAGWIEMFENHPRGLRCFGTMIDGRTWIVFKIYLPEIKISPVYRIHSSNTDSDNPTFYKQPVRDWLNSKEGRGSLASVNASYFNLNPSKLMALWPTGYGVKGDKAELAHLLGYENEYISRGYSPTELGVKYFRTYNGKAYISNALSTGKFELLIGGYDPVSVDKEKNEKIGRTMIGIPYDGSEIVYIFCSGAFGGAKQSEVISALRSFDCTKMIMLDGSGSSQATWGVYFRLISSEDPIVNRNVPIVLRMDHR